MSWVAEMHNLIQPPISRQLCLLKDGIGIESRYRAFGGNRRREHVAVRHVLPGKWRCD
jgi:hypothetical protein